MAASAPQPETGLDTAHRRLEQLLDVLAAEIQNLEIAVAGLTVEVYAALHPWVDYAIPADAQAIAATQAEAELSQYTVFKKLKP